jgi:hypothetical protein
LPHEKPWGFFFSDQEGTEYADYKYGDQNDLQPAIVLFFCYFLLFVACVHGQFFARKFEVEGCSFASSFFVHFLVSMVRYLIGPWAEAPGEEERGSDGSSGDPSIRQAAKRLVPIGHCTDEEPWRGALLPQVIL